MPTPEDRMNRREHRMQAIAVFSFVCLIISLALGIVTASKTLDSASDIRQNTQRIYRARDQALLAQRRVQAVERHSRNRYKRSSGLARRSNRVARKAVRTTERVVTVLRREGYPVPGIAGKRGSRGAAGTTGATGAQGLQGVPGASVTDAQIDAAVARHCAANICGRPPSQEQVEAAVRSCAMAGLCRGPQGRPPSREDVTDAVTAYCESRSQCAGPKGDPGVAGVSAGTFTFEFSFADGQGVLQTRRCTVDPTIGPEVTQACNTPPTG
jgi:hypothetical protein